MFKEEPDKSNHEPNESPRLLSQDQPVGESLLLEASSLLKGQLEDSCSTKILIVDANVLEKIAIKGIFSQYQFESDLAANGKQAVDMVQARLESGHPMYSLIIMDYNIPIFNGAKATNMIKNLQLDHKDSVEPYIVCLTNFKEDNKIRMEVLNAGMNELVGKPIFKSGIYRLLVAAELDPLG